MADGDLTTLDNLKTCLGITTGAGDAKLSMLITACSVWVKQYLNRDILTTQYAETLNGTGTRQIQVTNYPVTEISSVTVDDYDVTDKAFSDGRRLITLKDGLRFRRDVANVAITYTAGFDTCPADLELTVIRLVQWAKTEMDRPQQTSKSMGGEVVSFSAASAPQWAIDNLKNWKRVI